MLIEGKDGRRLLKQGRHEEIVWVYTKIPRLPSRQRFVVKAQEIEHSY
jgi:hypothetical protein